MILNFVFLLSACNSVTNETKPINLPNNEISVSSKPKETKLELAAKNISAKNFFYINDFNKIPVAYVEIDQLKIIGLDPKINYSIISIDPKTNNSTIGIIKYKLFNDNKSSIELTQEIKGFKSNQDEIFDLNNIAKKIKILKFTGNYKTPKVGDFVIENLPKNYKLQINELKNNNIETNFLKVKYKIYKSIKIKSDIQTASLNSLDYNLKNELNVIIKNITLTYSGNKSNTFVENIDQTKLKFTDFDKNKFSYKIISVNPKFNDSEIAVIKYVITSKNDVKSDIKTQEISGFLKRFTKKELNKKINSIKLTVDYDVMLKNISDLNVIEIKSVSGLTNGLELVDVNKIKKSDSEIDITFKIQQKNGNIKSDKKTFTFNRFRTKLKNFEGLNNVLNRINEIKYNGDVANTEINEINFKNITFLKLSKAYKIAQFVVIPVDNKTSVKIIFRISEIGGTIISKEKSFILKGFKNSNKDVINIDQLTKTITATYNNGAETAFLTFNDIKTNQIKFNNLDKSKYQVVINPLIILDKEGTKISVYYYLKNIKTMVISNTHKIDINGFMSATQKINQLNKITKKITFSYPNSTLIVLKNITDIDQSKITFDGYDKTKYKLIITNVDFEHEIDDDDIIDKSKVYVDFILKEKNSDFESSLKSKFINFKKV